MMIETTRVDTNISPLSQSYENTDLDAHEREEKLYAKIFDPSEFEGKTKDDLYGEFIWEFSEDQFKSLVKYNLQITLGRKEKGEVQLRKLKDTSSLYENVRLKTESGKSDTNIEIEIHLRSPLIDKEYEDDYRDILKIVKIYPEFVFKE